MRQMVCYKHPGLSPLENVWTGTGAFKKKYLERDRKNIVSGKLYIRKRFHTIMTDWDIKNVKSNH